MILFSYIPFLIILSSSYFVGPIDAIGIELPEAYQIALETSGELLPPHDLAYRVEKDLQSIRSRHPEVANITHTPKWEPGFLIFRGQKSLSYRAINNSVYGPVEGEKFFEGEVVFAFSKPYNPVKLAELLAKEFGVTGAIFKIATGDPSSVRLTRGKSDRNKYVFYSGAAVCPSELGCRQRRHWTYTVEREENSVQRINNIVDPNYYDG